MYPSCSTPSALTTHCLLLITYYCLLIQDDPFMFNTFCTVTEPDEVTHP